MEPRATSVEHDVLSAERRYWQALKDNDVDTMIRLTDDPCIVSGSQGVGTLDAQSFRDMMKAPSWKLLDFELSDMQVLQLSNDVAIVAYKVHEAMNVDGEPLELDAVDCSTWIRRDDGWRCALHTEALRGDPFGRDRS